MHPADSGQADRGAAAEFLSALARAIQRHHTYPPESPLCREAVREAREALRGLGFADRLVLLVGPDELYLDDRPLRAGRAVAVEVARRLHRADAGSVTFDREASEREIAAFCRELVRREEAGGQDASLDRALDRAGVTRIETLIQRRMQVVAVPEIPAGAARRLEDAERRRASSADAAGETAVGHLYSPDIGWIRIDPGAEVDTFAMSDLPLLFGDPEELSEVLTRLAEDGSTAGADGERPPLAERFEEIANLYASVDPALVDGLFGRLAEAVLRLEPDRRRELLRTTILPGLLEGGVDGAVLRHFPDADLADSLSLLLELRIAAPEVLSIGLDRLDLPADRRADLVPLLKSRLTERGDGAGPAPGTDALPDLAADLVRLDAADGRDLHEFAAFDLSVDPETSSRLVGLGRRIASSDGRTVSLRTLRALLSLGPGEETAARIVERIADHLASLVDEARVKPAGRWIRDMRQLGEHLRPERPELAASLEAMLAELCTPRRFERLVESAGAGGARAEAARELLSALGPAAAVSIVRSLETEKDRGRRRRLLDIACRGAADLAPGLAIHVDHEDWFVARNLVRILGHAGPGFETALSPVIDHGDPRVMREAFTSLARVGSARAASLVAEALEHPDPDVRREAEDALWRFPTAVAVRRVGSLLTRREFVGAHPVLARRLLARAVEVDPVRLRPVAESLRPYRFFVWRPSLVRLGFAADRWLRHG
ncbi:MAG: HEAT repeat domain-containing protein [Gemmatimonadota bacterium]